MFKLKWAKERNIFNGSHSIHILWVTFHFARFSHRHFSRGSANEVKFRDAFRNMFALFPSFRGTWKNGCC